MKKIVLPSLFVCTILLLMPFVSGIESNLIENEYEEKFNDLSKNYILKILILLWLISPFFNLIRTLMMDGITLSDFNIMGLITLFYSSLIVNFYFFINNLFFIFFVIIYKLFGEDERPFN